MAQKPLGGRQRARLAGLAVEALVPDLKPSIYLSTLCYGGMAHASYMDSLLALRAACAERQVPLQIDLSGGEALVCRGRAAAMAKFLATSASHLLIVGSDVRFLPATIFRLLDFAVEVAGAALSPADVQPDPDERQQRDGFQAVAGIGSGLLLISREAASRMTEGYPELTAKFGDMPSAGVTQAVMVFDSMRDPATGRYLADYYAFCRRWRALGGKIWADTEQPYPQLAMAQKC